MKYLKRFWQEEEIWFFFEIGDDNYPNRQIQQDSLGNYLSHGQVLNEALFGEIGDQEYQFNEIEDKLITNVEFEYNWRKIDNFNSTNN